MDDQDEKDVLAIVQPRLKRKIERGELSRNDAQKITEYVLDKVRPHASEAYPSITYSPSHMPSSRERADGKHP